MARFVGTKIISGDLSVNPKGPSKPIFLDTSFDFDVDDVDADEVRSQLVYLQNAGDITFYEMTDEPAAASSCSLQTPAAASVDAVHAQYLGNNPVHLFPGPIVNPVTARNLSATFEAGWTGGNITVVGTDQFGQPVTEVITASAGATVAGLKIFKTVTSITKGAVGASKYCSIGVGNKLGLLFHIAVPCASLAVDGVNEVGTWDATYQAVTPTSAPNAARTYSVAK